MAQKKSWTKSNKKGSDRNSNLPFESFETTPYTCLTGLFNAAAEMLSEFKKLKFAVVENFSGGFVTQQLCDHQKLSKFFERGFIVNDDLSLKECLGISETILKSNQRNSIKMAEAMAQGALLHSNSSLAIAVAGFTDPKDLQTNKIGTLSFAACYQNVEDPSKLELKSYQKEFDCSHRSYLRMIAAYEVASLLSNITIEFLPADARESLKKDKEILDFSQRIEEFGYKFVRFKDNWDHNLRERFGITQSQKLRLFE